jgi:alkyl hydroperoxide reductase subunit AhpC
MIHPNTSETKTVRTVFIIDPNSIIRTILYYPQTTGRNIKEIKRILIALQTTDAFKVSTPADWIPGAPVIEPSPQNTNDLKKRINNTNKNIDVQSWYLAFKNLPENKIFNRIKKKKS